MNEYDRFKPQLAFPERDAFKSYRVVIGDQIYKTLKKDFPEFVKSQGDIWGKINTDKLMSVTNVTELIGTNGIEIIIQPKFDEGGYRDAQKAYRDSTNDGIKAFKVYLEKEYGTTNYPKKDKVFQKAWEDCKSFGFNAVDDEYEELVELLAL